MNTDFLSHFALIFFLYFSSSTQARICCFLFARLLFSLLDQEFLFSLKIVIENCLNQFFLCFSGIRENDLAERKLEYVIFRRVFFFLFPSVVFMARLSLCTSLSSSYTLERNLISYVTVLGPFYDYNFV